MQKEEVYRFLTQIPKGKVVTYGQIAEHLGNKKYARAVGNVLHANPDPARFPCYKVVSAAGKLSAQFADGGIDVQKARLERDGIEVCNYRVDLKKFQYSEKK
ncbi:MAG: MGMT family protein [Fibrobacter sp.]|jgi:O-6-methylguanine DNA methyltransferase|nr:MGMT family protein [Fibrobacter sp.]MDY6369406.1 MGMT family protein [Fibrobacter sp.]MDY6390860.1 MGMT family protein [Fibrobacter sp.]